MFVDAISDYVIAQARLARHDGFSEASDDLFKAAARLFQMAGRRCSSSRDRRAFFDRAKRALEEADCCSCDESITED